MAELKITAANFENEILHSDKPRPYNAAYCAESDITSSQAGAALVAARGLRDKVDS